MAATLFFSYSHKDEQLRDKLEISLVMLKRQGLIDAWHDRRITAGDELDGAVDRALERADVILLLVSPDFLASAYCYDREMKRAMERHQSGEAKVIPVILRPCEWHHADFGTLMAIPTDGKPVKLWANEDEAFLDITKAIRVALAKMSAARVNPSPGKVVPAATDAQAATRARSSNLRVTKTFTERDRDLFLHEAFECVANLFEGSLIELEARNPGIEASYRRIDANRFAAAIYRGGKAISRCTIFLGGYTRGITEIRYSNGDTDGSSSSWNDSLSVEAEEHGLHLKAMGMLQRTDRLSLQGGAEYLWARLMEPLQRR